MQSKNGKRSTRWTGAMSPRKMYSSSLVTMSRVAGYHKPSCASCITPMRCTGFQVFIASKNFPESRNLRKGVLRAPGETATEVGFSKSSATSVTTQKIGQVHQGESNQTTQRQNESQTPRIKLSNKDMKKLVVKRVRPVYPEVARIDVWQGCTLQPLGRHRFDCVVRCNLGGA